MRKRNFHGRPGNRHIGPAQIGSSISSNITIPLGEYRRLVIVDHKMDELIALLESESFPLHSTLRALVGCKYRGEGDA